MQCDFQNFPNFQKLSSILKFAQSFIRNFLFMLRILGLTQIKNVCHNCQKYCLFKLKHNVYFIS